ncbi:hypothetical protein OEW28_15485 [Defluviimonas sp. WL0002]|uniref:DUF3329 domain-containing protein n=1 Tax=Albidovulum marisflavi TaxID=2984159 RepID=A0ABT2ZG78_9RHOB|nr:hypothetical protein [Defluviimonas sp. WL0002]MCV2870033.1 hypothetical protein [Defluviimonas sp. WL0002]
MPKFLDREHPIFRRLWVRVATVAAPLGWAVLEIAAGNPLWAVIFGALGGYALYELFLRRS